MKQLTLKKCQEYEVKVTEFNFNDKENLQNLLNRDFFYQPLEFLWVFWCNSQQMCIFFHILLECLWHFANFNDLQNQLQIAYFPSWFHLLNLLINIEPNLFGLIWKLFIYSFNKDLHWYISNHKHFNLQNPCYF